jgi:hypothetical protein
MTNENQPSPAAIRAAHAIAESASVDWDHDEIIVVALIIDRNMSADPGSNRSEPGR